LDYTTTRTIERELLLCKVSILGPEYFEDQLASKIEEARAAEAAKYQGNDPITYEEIRHAVEPGTPADEVARQTEAAAEASHPGVQHHYPGTSPTPPRQSLTPSEALRQKHMHLNGIETLAKQFGGKVVDVSNDCVIVELSGKTNRIDAFLKLVRPYGILEAARTGTMVMPRAPIQSPWTGLSDEEPAEEESAAIDAGLLPPG
jgi:acetolactate synthase-1/3 small subunit